MLINFDVRYKMLSNRGPTSEKHLSTCWSLATAMKLIKVKFIFKYFCSMDVIMSWKAALNWNCLDFRTAASALSHCGVVWMAEQGAQLCKNSPSPKIHQIQFCWPLSPIWYNCMSTAWISSHFCKCKSQVKPLKRGLDSGKQGESEANSSLCRYSVKSCQHWKNSP